MATWSISVSSIRPCWSRREPRCEPSAAVATEHGDLVLADPFALLGVVDAEPLFGREAQDADLALVLVAVDLERSLTGLVERVHGRQQGLDLAEVEQSVGCVRLLVVGEVA